MTGKDQERSTTRHWKAALPLAGEGSRRPTSHPPAGRIVIERMTDHGFRQWTRAIIFAISVVYLARGGWLLWHG